MEKKRGVGPALLALISQGASTPLLLFQSNGINIPRDDDPISLESQTIRSIR